MKLQILDQAKKDDAIKNYTVSYITPMGLDLSNVSDNECDSILAPDICDSFPLQVIPDVLSQLKQKLRMGGELVVGGTDLRSFCKMVYAGLMDQVSAANLVHNSKSFSILEMTQNTLKEFGLKVVETHMNGIHYEVKVIRGEQ